MPLVRHTWVREFMGQLQKRTLALPDGTPKDPFHRMYGREGAVHVGPNVLRSGLSAWVESITSPATVLVAELDGVPDEVVGWLCRERGVAMHYLFTKKVARRHGVARELVRQVDREEGEPLRLSYLNAAGRAVLSSARQVAHAEQR